MVQSRAKVFTVDFIKSSACCWVLTQEKVFEWKRFQWSGVKQGRPVVAGLFASIPRFCRFGI